MLLSRSFILMLVLLLFLSFLTKFFSLDSFVFVLMLFEIQDQQITRDSENGKEELKTLTIIKLRKYKNEVLLLHVCRKYISISPLRSFLTYIRHSHFSHFPILSLFLNLSENSIAKISFVHTFSFIFLLF